jgi:hypothetical protein
VLDAFNSSQAFAAAGGESPSPGEVLTTGDLDGRMRVRPPLSACGSGRTSVTGVGGLSLDET